MRLAHVRPLRDAARPWRLAAALDPDGTIWFDLETARLAVIDAGGRRDDPVFAAPISTIDHHLSRGLRVAELEPLLAGAARVEPLAAGDLAFGPPILEPVAFRDFYSFEGHARATWLGRAEELPEAWSRLAIFYFQNTSEIRGPGDAVWAPLGSSELDFELEIGALLDGGGRNLGPDEAEAVIAGYFILNDWSARDLHRDEATVGMGPAKGKDFATSIGPWLVTPDELADRRAGAGYRLRARAQVNDVPVTDGNWRTISRSFGEMLGRASTDVRLRSGEIVGSGTVETGSLIEMRERTLGRYLEPGDVVTVAIERLGAMTTPIVARP